MKKTWLLALLLAGFSVASAKTYSITIYDRCMAGKVQVQPGDYRMKLEGNTAVFTNQDNGKKFEANVSVQNVPRKFDQTAIDMTKVAGEEKIQEIHLGGTRMDIKFN
jgi:hypothetical protein